MKTISTQIDLAQGERGNFLQATICLTSWEGVDDELCRDFGQVDEDGKVWLVCVPISRLVGK